MSATPDSVAVAQPWHMRLTQAWRVCACGMLFVLFGLFGLLLGGLILPVICACTRDSALRRWRVRRVIGGACALFVRFAGVIGSFHVHMTGAHWLRTPGAVIAPTHPTLLDVTLLLAVAPQLECVVKRAVLRNPFLAAVALAAGYIDNGNDGPALVERCAAIVRAGGSVLVFPEGTRTDPLRPVRLRRGAAAIALAANASLVPVVMWCDPPALTKRHHWYDLPPNPLQLHSQAQPPWSASAYAQRTANRALAARAMTTDLQRFYRAELQSD